MEQNTFLGLLKDEAFRTELSAYIEEKKPQTCEEKYNAIIAFAASKGYVVTVEEIAASEAANREMDDSELDNIAGGWCWSSNYCSNIIQYKKGNKNCATTYNRGELCLTSDWCENAINYYKYDDRCKTTYEWFNYCTFSDRCNIGANNYS